MAQQRNSAAAVSGRSAAWPPRRFFPRGKLHPREIYSSGGGLLVVEDSKNVDGVADARDQWQDQASDGSEHAW